MQVAHVQKRAFDGSSTWARAFAGEAVPDTFAISSSMVYFA